MIGLALSLLLIGAQISIVVGEKFVKLATHVSRQKASNSAVTGIIALCVNTQILRTDDRQKKITR